MTVPPRVPLLARRSLASLLSIASLQSLPAAELALPPRPAEAPAGRSFVQRVTGLSPAGRERLAVQEILSGNIPDALRRLVPVTMEDGARRVTLQVAPDYLSVGTDSDFFLTPLSPAAAQEIADKLGAMLPTRKMVDAIHRAALVKLEPIRMPPDASMTTLPVFAEHSEKIAAQRGVGWPAGLIAGHKKDVVISSGLTPGKVAIYGWHTPDGKPIQPLFTGHAESWVDYSHGIRLVLRAVETESHPDKAETILADSARAALLSDEGAFLQTRYETAPPPETWEILPGVTAALDLPAETKGPVRLAVYALPNGSTIRHTMGRRVLPGDDWHYDIQHIAAQTRWLREHDRDLPPLAVAYLECAEKSWPAWRKKNGDSAIPGILAALRDRFPGREVRLTLTGHSGGGSFTFGYLNTVDAIPPEVERIAFLDSNYAYDVEKGHARKLAAWLQTDAGRALCVMAYHDSNALLNGKPFVSAGGGTWGRSHAMLRDLGKEFPFSKSVDGHITTHSALDGRARFLLRGNPDRAILHTRLVEWNGFLHAMRSGTVLQNEGHTWCGPRAYEVE